MKTTPSPEPLDGSKKLLAETIEEWLQLVDWLSAAKEREKKLREFLVKKICPEPKEGTNNVDLLDNRYKAKVVHKINRSLDTDLLDKVMMKMPPEYREVGVLISYEPSMDLKTYRTLDEKTKKVFDQALVIKEGAPTLEISKLTPVTKPKK